MTGNAAHSGEIAGKSTKHAPPATVPAMKTVRFVPSMLCVVVLRDTASLHNTSLRFQGRFFNSGMSFKRQ